MGSSRSYIDLYDLHLHTYWSYDATAHPENYFRRARELGLHCLAIADHHVLDSLDEVLKLAKEYPDIRTIPAAELTVTTSIGSVDLLCYGLPCNFPEELQKILDEYHAWQQEAGDAISRGLQVLGHDFTDAHRQYFLEHGFINKEEDYSALMTQVRKAVPFPPYPDVKTVVPVVKGTGALVVISHPYGYFKGYDVPRMEAIREECHLDGIECVNKSNIPPEYTRLYREYCVQHGLLSTVGSDCHSDEDIPYIFAYHKGFPGHEGSDEWLDEILERLDKGAGCYE